jgi:hypothetical protein
MTVFWNVAPFSLTEIYRRFGDAVFNRAITEPVSTSETLVSFYETTRSISYVHTRRRPKRIENRTLETVLHNTRAYATVADTIGYSVIN